MLRYLDNAENAVGHVNENYARELMELHTLGVGSGYTQEDVEALAKAFGKKLNKRVAFHVSTDPSLLAGMKVTVNGVTYDGTLRSQLQKLRDQIKVAEA